MGVIYDNKPPGTLHLVCGNHWNLLRFACSFRWLVKIHLYFCSPKMVINPIFGCHNKRDGLMKVKKITWTTNKTSWWFQPSWKILVNLDDFLILGMKIKIFEFPPRKLCSLFKNQFGRFFIYKFMYQGFRICKRCKAKTLSSWWFQPCWKILVKMGIFPKQGWK